MIDPPIVVNREFALMSITDRPEAAPLIVRFPVKASPSTSTVLLPVPRLSVRLAAEFSRMDCELAVEVP